MCMSTTDRALSTPGCCGRARNSGYGWSIPLRTGPKAAGVIHSDFEKGYIRAEVIGYDDYITYGSEAAARSVGKLRTEGKEYIVKDGDVMHFLFNV